MGGDGRQARTARLAGAAVLLLALSACSSGGDSKVDTEDAAATSSTTASTLAEDLTAPTQATASTAPTTTARGAAPPTTARAGAASPRQTTTTARTAATQPPPTTTTTARSGPTAAITIQNFAFSPPVLNISAGTTVTATNLDSAPHSWTADDASWDSGTLNKDGKHSRTFTTPGTFPYHCKIHPSMKGTVRVT